MTPHSKNLPFRYLATFVYLMLFWLFLSGHYDIFHISIGILCCAGVSYASTDLLFACPPSKKRHIIFFQFVIYLGWLLYQIVLANLQVARLVLSPRLAIDPCIIVYNARLLQGDVAQATFGNSITLTPGTITLDIRNTEFHVHALTPAFAEDLKNGAMEGWVARVYH
ncbi:MAG: Na+/H+ antiporter subunit E [Deltaproteobacteria bacterium]|nr:Na+/H+ antiporter subunit E [Deltaproteobacteria bacterium]